MKQGSRFRGSPVKFAALLFFEKFNGASKVQRFRGSRFRIPEVICPLSSVSCHLFSGDGSQR